ncbi:tRNA:m(4)X modification enzyme TRM13 homolog [Aphomia sociella]
MVDCINKKQQTKVTEGPQCQFFVIRKKRLCRMTVRPGRQYCGEHEPKPKTEDGSDDKRIPCPNDPKHTCYVSKLEKHLSICNARQVEQPSYIVPNINAPFADETSPRKPLSEISKERLMLLINKVNLLYEKHVQGNVTTFPEQPIHSAVLDDFNEENRTESSRRHIRQASSLLWIMEKEGLVQDNTCYIELGAGKGQLSLYASRAWCGAGSSAVLLDRAALRHKRDARLRREAAAAAAVTSVLRVRADLAHVALRRVPPVRRSRRRVGFAKHLCGAAADYAIRCMVGAGSDVESETEDEGMKIETGSEVKAGTENDGGSGAERETRRGGEVQRENEMRSRKEILRGLVLASCCHHRGDRAAYVARTHLKELGIDDEDLDIMMGIVSWATCGDGRSRDRRRLEGRIGRETDEHNTHKENTQPEEENGSNNQEGVIENDSRTQGDKDVNKEKLSYEYREQIGKRAKALLDWGRVLYLREKGFDARLCHYVPTSVSLENMCIIAKK